MVRFTGSLSIHDNHTKPVNCHLDVTDKEMQGWEIGGSAQGHTATLALNQSCGV